jgi:hypothetical protein
MSALNIDDTPIQRLLLHPCGSHELNPVHLLRDLPLVTLSDYSSPFGHPCKPIHRYLTSLADHGSTNGSLQHYDREILGVPLHPVYYLCTQIEFIGVHCYSAESEYISYGTRTADTGPIAPIIVRSNLTLYTLFHLSHGRLSKLHQVYATNAAAALLDLESGGAPAAGSAAVALDQTQ